MNKEEILSIDRMASSLYLIRKGNEYYFFTRSESGRSYTIWRMVEGGKPEKVIRVMTEKEAMRMLKDKMRNEGFLHVRETAAKQFISRNIDTIKLVGIGTLFATAGAVRFFIRNHLLDSYDPSDSSSLEESRMNKDQILKVKRMTDALYLINRGNEYYFFTRSESGRSHTIWKMTEGGKPEKVIRVMSKKEAMRMMKDKVRNEGFSHVRETAVKQFVIRNFHAINYGIMGSSIAAMGAVMYKGIVDSQPPHRPYNPTPHHFLEAFGDEFVDRLENRQQIDEGLMSFFRKFRLRPTRGNRIPSSLDGLRQYIENMGFITSEDPKTALQGLRAKKIMIGNRRPDIAEKKLLSILVEYIEGEDVSKHEAVVEDIRRGIGQLINMSYSEAESDYIYYMINLYDGVASSVEMSKRGITFKELNA